MLHTDSMMNQVHYEKYMCSELVGSKSNAKFECKVEYKVWMQSSNAKPGAK